MATFVKPLVPVLNIGTFLVDDLVMALPTSEGAGSALVDISGNSHDATIAGTEGVDFQWVDDPEMGIVLELLTASGWIDMATTLATAFAGQGAGAMSCWLKLNADTPPAGQRGLANLDDISGSGTRTIYPDGSNQIDSGVLRSSGRFNDVDVSSVDKSQWHLLTITSQNGGFYRVWLNGVELSGTVADLTIGMATPLQFGRSDDSDGSDRLAGLIGDVRLWKRSLQGYEIATIFNNPWGLYTGPDTPAEVELFTISAGYAHRGAYTVGQFGAVVDALDGRGRHSGGDFGVIADVTKAGGAYDPPVEIPARLSPFRKPQLNAVPAPTLNSDPINTSVLLALLYNDPAGAQDPLTEYGPNAHQATGIVWGAQAASDGLPGSSSRFVLSEQATSAFANGNGGSVARALTLEPVQPFSVAVHVKFEGTPSAGGILIGKAASGGGFAYALRIDPGDNDRIRFDMTDVTDGLATVLGPNGQIVAGFEATIVGTYDGAIMRLYINGVEVGTQVNADNLDHDTTADLGIGQDGAGGTSPGGNVVIESAFLWDRDLSANEALKLHDNPFGMFCDSGYSQILTVSAGYAHRGAHSVGDFGVVADALDGRGRHAVGDFGVVADLLPGVTNVAGLSFFSISPLVGPDTGGQTVQIKGRNFFNVTQVLLGGFPLTSLNVLDSNTIEGVTPNHLPGIVSVRIDTAEIGFVEAPDVYTFVGGFQAPTDQLIRGNMIDESFFRQETFTGETAPAGAQTTLSLTLSDIPIHPEAVEVYVRRLDAGHATTDDGAKLMRFGAIHDYTVDIANRKIIWEPTASFELLPADEITVVYLARGEL